MRKNVASQVVGAQLNSKTDGSAVTTGTTTVSYTGDGGTYTTGSVGSGAATHKGGGYWEYSPSQGETNFDHVAFTFVNTSAVTATVQIYPSFPQTGDNYARLGAPAGASVSADVAAVKSDTAAVKTQTDKLTFTVANQVDSNVLDWKSSTAPAMTGDAFARLGAPAGASVSADVAAIKALVPTALAADGSIKASVQSFLGTAFTEGAGGRIAAAFKQFFNIATPAATMDHLVLVDTVTTATTATNLTNAPTAGDFTATMKTSLNAATPAVTVSDKTGFSLTSAYDPAKTAAQAGDAMALTSGERTSVATAVWASGTRTLSSFGTLVADIATAVWGATTRLLTAGTNIVLAKGTGVTGFNDLDAAGVQAAVGLASANLDTQLGALPTAAENADAVWEEAIADHDGTVGSTAEALSNATGGGGGSPTAADIADAVWDEALADHQDSGSTGEALNGAGAAGNPWIAVGEGSYSTLDLLRFAAAVAAGKDSIAKHGTNRATVTFRNVTDTADIIVAEMNKGERESVTLNP